MVLKKPIKMKELLVFLILGLYTVPIMRKSVIDNPEAFDSMDGYMDMLLAILVVFRR
jgi:hypothetical protein